VASWSAVMLWLSQPVFCRLFGDCGSLTFQFSETSPVYQPLSPVGLVGSSEEPMTGALGSMMF
jgi:hypothetical protein